MSDTRAQIRLLLARAAELRTQSQEIQRKLTEIFAEVAKLTARRINENHPTSGGRWRTGPDKPRNPNSQNE
jgi:hypothetical protein